jgi:hypothetical protein
MPTFETTASIDIDLSAFTDDELREELESRGEPVSYDISDFDDHELFAEVEARGGHVTKETVDLSLSEIDMLLSKLGDSYKIGSAEYFLYEKLVYGKQYAKN